MQFRLERPLIKHKERAFNILGPYLEADGGIEGCAALDCFLEDNDYEGWLANLDVLLNDPAPDFSPLEAFFFMEEDRIIGMVSIFHRLLPEPHNTLGHLGYSIHPQERRKGKGAVLLTLALDYCYQLGIDRVMVSTGEHNTASLRLVEKCGGTYERSVEVNDVGDQHMVYWFENPKVRS